MFGCAWLMVYEIFDFEFERVALDGRDRVVGQLWLYQLFFQTEKAWRWHFRYA